jgi:ubiquinone/menaquinone biosynthesis C-methylase UbiE
MSYNLIKTKLLNTDLIIDFSDLEEDSKVADFGCGQLGYFIFPLARVIGEKGVVYAVDIIKEYLEIIKKEAEKNNLKQIKTIWHDLESSYPSKIKSSDLDAVLIINTLSQTEKPSEIIKEAGRILKENGKLIIVDWEKTSPFKTASGKKTDKNNLIKKIPDFGFSLEKDFKAGIHNYGLIFKKL